MFIGLYIKHKILFFATCWRINMKKWSLNESVNESEQIILVNELKRNESLEKNQSFHQYYAGYCCLILRTISTTWLYLRKHPSTPSGKEENCTLNYYSFSQSLWYISWIILDICKTVSAFLKTTRKNSKTPWLPAKASLLLKILSSSFKNKYLSMNMSVPAEWQVLVYG